jgi:hypothetical protein
MSRENLNVEYFIGRTQKVFAVVRNFLGLDAEMSEADLRKMSAQLTLAADKLAHENK